MSVLKCKGKGKAKGFGCGMDLKFTERNGIKTYFQKYGLGIECKCYSNWLLNSEQGEKEINKAKITAKKASDKKERAESKERKWELMSYAQKVGKAKVIFQRWIRNRDKDLPCISCRTNISDIWDGGHFKKAEIFSGVIFHEHNTNRQCRKCNHYLGGHESEYRKGLIERIGLENVENLEDLANKTRQYRYSDTELKDIMSKYKI